MINLQYPYGKNFDEFHYVPSAKQFLSLLPNQNWEHPPLGKLLMAVGIGVVGDTQVGWRIMSTIFGAMTCVGVFFLAWILFQSEEAALWVVGITLANQLLYVQSRIGMLDTFMFAFLIWAMVGFCATWLPATAPLPPGTKPVKGQVPVAIKRWKNSTLLGIAGVGFGYATACKWFGVVPWAACVGLILWIRFMQYSGASPRAKSDQEWYQPRLWNDVKWSTFLVTLVGIPLLCYFSTFIPYLFIHDGPGGTMGSHSPLEWWEMQFKMYDGQLRVVSSHPYMSQWLDWPLLTRPIWYAFEKEPGDPNSVRGVLLLGNPLMMWTGLLALAVCAWEGIKKRKTAPFLISFFYAAFYGCWVAIPRKIAFYYYYYPAGMMLSFALAYVFYSATEPALQVLKKAKWLYMGAAIGIFVYFFPILAAFKIPAEAFRNWMWFRSWI